MNIYERKQEARRARLEAAADRASNKANDLFRRADLREEVSGIPFGQPILVGHHSEGRHRRAIERADNAMRKSIEESKRAQELAGRAASVGTGGISSDDPDAIAKLKAELAECEQFQLKMRAANPVIRAFYKAGLRPDATPEDAARYLEKMEAALGTSYRERTAREMLKPDFAGRIGFADYQLTNNGANIRRIKQRIEQLEAAATREHKEIERADGIRIVQNVEENRLQLIFPGKPADDMRAKLKSYGFRWSPTAGAWQRQLSNAAIWAAGQVLKGEA